ncbi:MAG: hypothetical protein ACI9R3_000462 [Verrucomicrobiales bacterium]|jgi:hypothetical protein
MSDSFSGLQAILGTDKKNPMFAVYRDEQKRELHIYYGFELLEVVPDDKTSPRFKLMVAQLYNAGVKGITLVEVFKVDPKFMRRWGRALKSGDPETLIKALQGRGPRKLTPEIKAYIKRRFPILYEENPHNYSSRLRKEIFEIFNVRISGEGLRLHFHELKAQHQHESGAHDQRAAQNEKEPLTSCESEDPPPPQSPPTEDAPDEQSAHNAPDGTEKAEQPSAKKGALDV